VSAGPGRALQRLIDDFDAARAEFLSALADVDPGLVDAPGLVGDWSARLLVGHLAAWTEHASGALEAAAVGRADDFDEAGLDVDERNASIAKQIAGTPLAELRQREEVAARRLRAALGEADAAWLEERVSYGDSLAEVIRDDGADHYREHAADIRAWFTGEPEADEADAHEPEGAEPGGPA
jgi:Mycothiol maleylpyruvate isomerase N-terminal domain